MTYVYELHFKLLAHIVLTHEFTRVLNVPLLFRSQVMLALGVVPVEVVILSPQLFKFNLGSPEFLIDLSHSTLPSTVLLAYSLLRLSGLLIRSVPLSAGLIHLTFLVNDLLPQLIDLCLQLSPVLELACQSHLQRVTLFSQSRH